MSGAAETGARIFLVDDHPAVLEGLSLLLTQLRYEVCGVASSRAEVRERLGPSRADLVLLDLAMCGESGLDILPDLAGCAIPALVYSMHEDAATVRRALECGICGYVTKRETSAVLLEAIRRVLAGERCISPRAMASLEADPSGPAGAAHLLSDREQQILALVAQGESNAEIAETLGVSVRTVETYCSRVTAKLNLEGMKALRKYALQFSRPV